MFVRKAGFKGKSWFIYNLAIIEFIVYVISILKCHKILLE